VEVGQINRNSSDLYIFLYYFIHDIILIIFRIIKTKSTRLNIAMDYIQDNRVFESINM